MKEFRELMKGVDLWEMDKPPEVAARGRKERRPWLAAELLVPELTPRPAPPASPRGHGCPRTPCCEISRASPSKGPNNPRIPTFGL